MQLLERLITFSCCGKPISAKFLVEFFSDKIPEKMNVRDDGKSSDGYGKEDEPFNVKINVGLVVWSKFSKEKSRM